MQARRLFLSYARPERPRVEVLASDLRRAGCEVFFDEQLTTGENWWNALLDEIEGCNAFVPVLSQAYVVSTPCRLEAEYAHSLNKPLLPIMIEVMNPDECSSFIAETHCLQYDHADANSVLDLARALMMCPECPELPDERPPRPPVPLSYAGLTVQALRDRLDSTDDLTRQQQVLVLADLKAVMQSSEVNPATCRELLLVFSRRPELTVAIANEVTELLAIAQDTTETTPPKSPLPTSSSANYAVDTTGTVEKTDEPPPARAEGTVTLTCDNCSTVNRVTIGVKGYVCRGCETVTQWPVCRNCDKSHRVFFKKIPEEGRPDYYCPDCKKRQFIGIRISDTQAVVGCSCGEWNLMAKDGHGFTCGFCRRPHVFFLCPSCKDASCVTSPAVSSAKSVTFKSGCGKTVSLPMKNADTQGRVVRITTVYQTGSAPD